MLAAGAAVRIAAAQVPSVRGDLAENIATHVAAIDAAARHGVRLLVFPELSLVGYEPDLAATHALDTTDARLEPLAARATRHGMTVMVGAPLRPSAVPPIVRGVAAGAAERPALGAVLFGPDGARETYAKMHLGGSEPRHFAAGGTPLTLVIGTETVGLSICADSSEPSHPARYARDGATVYVASMFLNAEWDATDRPRLPRHAAAHRLLVLLANHGASTGTHASVGRSAAWAPDGTLLAEAPNTDPALVIATRAPNGWEAVVASL